MLDYSLLESQPYQYRICGINKSGTAPQTVARRENIKRTLGSSWSSGHKSTSVNFSQIYTIAVFMDSPKFLCDIMFEVQNMMCH